MTVSKQEFLSGNIDSKPADWRTVHWFNSQNSRKTSFGNPLSDATFKVTVDNGEEKVTGLTASGNVFQLVKGWDASQGAVKCRKATKAQADAAVKDREALIKLWESSPDTMPIAVVAKAAWFPGGKPVTVVWIANEAYRRGRGILGVLLRRAMAADYKMDKVDLLYRLPIVEVEFANELEQFASHVQENTLKDAGRVNYSEVDIFFNAKRLLALKPAAKEADLVKLGFKRGQAVKCFALALLDKQFPALKIADRVLAGVAPHDKDKPFVYSADCGLPMSKLKHDRLQKLKNGFAYNETSGDAAKKIKGGLQAKHVEQYFAAAINDAEEQRTVMGGEEIITALERSPIRLLAWLAAEIRGRNRECFALVEQQAERINKALSFVDLEASEAAEEAAEKEASKEADKPAKQAAKA
jgi:hypothetical protein